MHVRLSKTRLISSLRVRNALEPYELYAEQCSVMGPRSRLPERITLFLDLEILGIKAVGVRSEWYGDNKGSDYRFGFASGQSV
jgi:hypothetical protein